MGVATVGVAAVGLLCEGCGNLEVRDKVKQTLPVSLLPLVSCALVGHILKDWFFVEGPWVLESFYASLWDLFSLLWEGGYACWGCREGDVV